MKKEKEKEEVHSTSNGKEKRKTRFSNVRRDKLKEERRLIQFGIF